MKILGCLHCFPTLPSRTGADEGRVTLANIQNMRKQLKSDLQEILSDVVMDNPTWLHLLDEDAKQSVTATKS